MKKQRFDTILYACNFNCNNFFRETDMAKFNFDVEREVKRPGADRGKTFRIILLFCLVAAVTAGIIYIILPKNDPEKKVENLQEKAVELPAPGNNTVTPSENKDIPEKADKSDEKISNESEISTTVDDEKGDIPAVDEKSSTTEKSSNAPIAGNTAKYDPSDSELLKNTALLYQEIKNGSWKKGKDVVIYSVASGDSLERIARKNNNTLQFLKVANNISNVNSIRIGQKISFLKTEKWQITISRKNSKLQLDRFINGKAVPTALFPCRIKAGEPDGELMVSRRFSEPYFVDRHGRKFAPGNEGNPYGEGLLTLSRPSAPDARLNISIHGQGDAPAVEKSVESGGIALHNQDMELLYLLVPEKTPVKIIE